MTEGKITLFFWPTPTCYKVSILLEELNVPYDIHPVHIGRGEQFATNFLEIQWLMFQIGNLGPLLGQAHHFRHCAKETIEYAINRYTNEAGKLYAVLNNQLGKSQYLAGDGYSIADMAVHPWLRP